MCFCPMNHRAAGKELLVGKKCWDLRRERLSVCLEDKEVLLQPPEFTRSTELLSPVALLEKHVLDEQDDKLLTLFSFLQFPACPQTGLALPCSV